MSAALKICPVCATEYPPSERFCPRDGSALRAQGAESSDLVGQIVAERYHVLRKLGEGGMGQVYLAEHVKMGRKSALKVMNPGMVKDADAVSRFNREAANASRINHPNVASVYDFGETPDGLIFLAMEFVDGAPLTKVIEQAGALAPVRAAEIIRQAAEALAVAHDMGIVHRDLKPDNIMIARTRDGGDMVKVVDFGIAKAQDSSAQKVTKTGLVVGTPEYMSPEQLAGDKLDARSDIYSLGLVAFNMLTGTLPFPSDSAQESMIMRLTDKPKPLATMREEVSWPEDVQAVMDKVLERDVANRYQNATDFGRELVKTIDKMPHTKMVVAGTMVVGAAAAGRKSVDAPTQAMPATRIAPGTPERVSAVGSQPPAVAGAPSHGAAVSQKSKMPMMVVGGIALASIAAVAIIKPFGIGKQDTTTAPPLTQAASGDTGKKPDSAKTPTGQPFNSEIPRGGQANPQGTRSGGAASKTWTSLEISRALARWDDSSTTDSLTPARAKVILDSIDKLQPQFSTEEQSVKAAVIRAQFFAPDTALACPALRKVKDIATYASSGTTRVFRDVFGQYCGGGLPRP